MNIRARIIVLFGVIVIPATAVMIHHFREHRAELIRDKAQALLALAQNMAGELGNSVRQSKIFLQSLAQVSSIARGDTEECARVVRQLLSSTSRYTTIFATDAQGNAWCSADPSGVGSNFADREYFTTARESGKPAVGMPLLGRISRRPTLPVAIPLRDPAGAFSGALVLGLDLQWMEEQRSRNASTASMRISILSPDGTFLYRTPEGERWIGKRAADAAIVRWLAAHPTEATTVETNGSDGAEKIYAVARLEEWLGHRLALTIGVSRSSVTAPVDQDIVRTAGLLALVTGLALAIAFVWSERGLRRPIASLVGFSRRIASGDLTARDGIARPGGELGDLADSLEIMRSSIETYQSHLQELVAERTAELQAAHGKAVAALESMQDACAILAPVRDDAGSIVDFRYEYINETACRWIGLFREECLTRRMLDLFPERRDSDLFRQYVEIVETGKPLALYSVRCVGVDERKDSETLFDVQGTRVGDRCMVTWRDVARQQRSAREHELILQTAIDGFWIVGADGRFLEVNDAYCRMIGYDRGELLGMRISDVEAAETAEQTARHIGAVRAKGSDRFQTRHRRKDGTIIDVEVSTQLSSVRDDAFIVFVEDITARKKAEAYLQEFNVRLQAQVEEQTQALQGLVRSLRTLSAVNGALVKTRREPELLNDVCWILVREGGYAAAWIGIPEQDAAKTLRVAARFGDDRGLLDDKSFSWAESSSACNCAGGAMRDGVTVVTNNTSNEQTTPCMLEAARCGFQSMVALPVRGGNGIIGALVVYSLQAGAFTPEGVSLLEEMAGDLGYGIYALRNEERRAFAEQSAIRNLERLNDSLERTIEVVALTVEKRDPYTAGHQRRVTNLAVEIAKKLGLSSERIKGIQLGGLIHDIGKIYIPAEILNRPGRLNEHEYALIKTHPQVGYDIVKGVDFPWPVADMVLQHHERVDGSGYPQGLKGEAICLEARIIAVADVLEAITAHRPYRAGFGMQAGIDEIVRGRGTAYDPVIVDACVDVVSRVGFNFG